MSNIFIGITAYNRPEYLRQLLDSIEANQLDQSVTISIHIDGKDTEHLKQFGFLTDSLIHGIHLSDRQGVSVGRNKLLQQAAEINAKHIFLLDDDVYMLNDYWAILYMAHAHNEKVGHLSYYNPLWNNANGTFENGGVAALQSMGCLHYITRECFEAVGYYDVAGFGKRGYEHIDWSLRACRAGYADANRLMDIPDGATVVGMHTGSSYVPSLTKQEAADQSGDTYSKRILLKDDTRIYIPFNL